jgi:DNA invertase Pin-like site-specific DNA recombinase
MNRITALYARFSRDDGQETENASITNQKKLLQEYADSNGFTNCRIYADDGYTGTNFDRPDFQRMLEDIENGLVGTIIVKDMSRFGRNYILVGQYVELVLPNFDVRVIGITDNYDSNRNDNDLFAFENILNEMYTADISKKVTIAKRNKGVNGGRLKTHPIYGYRTVPGTIDDWEIDDTAATVVYMIFDMYVNQDMGEYKIANFLRKNKVVTSCVYFGSKQGNEKEPYNWTPKTIERMLGYQEYCGDTVNFKTKTVAYKTKTRIRNPKDEWQIFKNTHPAIISREMFRKAQEKLNRTDKRHYEKKHSYDTYFRRKCACSECQKTMIAYIPLDSEEVAYQCKDNVRFKTCTSHNVRETTLRRAFGEQLSKLHNALVSNQNEILEKLGVAEMGNLQAESEKSCQRMNEIDKYIQTLFESKIKHEISDEDFKMISERYSVEKAELQLQINKITAKLNKTERNSAGISQTFAYIKGLSENDLKNITSEMCDRLIEKVVIGESYWTGEVNYGKQKIDFYLKNIGRIGNLVDVSYKTFEQRVRSVLPKLIDENCCTTVNVCNMLGITYSVLKKGLESEGWNFTRLKVEVKASMRTK